MCSELVARRIPRKSVGNLDLIYTYLLVIGLGVKNIIKSKFVALNKFGKVNFLSKIRTLVRQILVKK
jgi:hypothetical protein